MLKKSAAADRAAALVETVRPIVTKAMNDPELHEALRQAFATGREVTGEIHGTPPAKVARKLAKGLAAELRRRHSRRIAEARNPDGSRYAPRKPQARRKKGRIRRFVGRVAVIGAAAGAAVVVLRKLRGGGGGGGTV